MKVKKDLYLKFEAERHSPFDRLFDIFKELITHTSGDLTSHQLAKRIG